MVRRVWDLSVAEMFVAFNSSCRQNSYNASTAFPRHAFERNFDPSGGRNGLSHLSGAFPVGLRRSYVRVGSDGHPSRRFCDVARGSPNARGKLLFVCSYLHGKG